MSSENVGSMNKNYISSILSNPTGWGHLPTELKAIVVKNMDLETTLNFRRCDSSSVQLVTNFSRHDVTIKVAHSQNFKFMTIEVLDFNSPMLVPKMYWMVSSKGSEGSEVEQKDGLFETISKDDFVDQKYWNITFSIMVRLITDPMFNVKKLQFELNNFNENIEFGRQIGPTDVEELCLTDCMMTKPVESLLQCFSQHPMRINVNFDTPERPGFGFNHSAELFRFFNGRECLFNLRTLLEFTDWPFNGDKELRDEDGDLTAKGFNRFLKILLARIVVAGEDVFRSFVIHKDFREQIEVAGNDLDRIHRVLEFEMNFFFTIEDSPNTVFVAFKEDSTSGFVCGEL